MNLSKTFILFFGATMALTAAEVRLTLASAGDYARRHNPALAAARFRIEEARGRLVQSGRLANPELDFEFRHARDFREGGLELGFMQKFPLTDRLRREKAVSRAELAAAEAEVRDAERKLRALVEAAAVKLIALEKQRELRERQLATSREAAQATLRRAAVGEASTVDAAQMELETQQLETERVQLDVERAALLGELRPLLGLRAGDTLQLRGELGVPTGLPTGDPTVASRPDVMAARHMAEAARQNVAVARANRWEDVGAGLFAEGERRQDDPEGLILEAKVGFRVSVPLPIWNRNEGRIQESAAAAARARKEVDARMVEAQGEAAAARSEMAALQAVLAEMNDKLLPKARDLEAQLQQIHAAGQGTLTDVLRATERRLQLESRRLDALRDYHLARVRYRAALGTPTKP